MDPRQPRWSEERKAAVHAAHSVVGDWHLAEDLAQETLLRLLDGRAVPKRGSSTPFPPAWVRRVARNLALNVMRDHGRRRKREALVARKDSVHEVRKGLDEDQVALLTGELSALREPYASTLRMRYIEGRSQDAIATRLGISLETVRSRQRRGLGLLRERLGQRDRPNAWSLLTLFGTGRRATLALGAAALVIAACTVALVLGRRGVESAALEVAAAAPLPALETQDPARSVATRDGPRLGEGDAPRAGTPPLRVVNGRVTDGAGSPILGARLWYSLPDAPDELQPSAARSASDGTFRLELRGGPAWVGATLRGHAPRFMVLSLGSEASERGAGEPLELEIERAVPVLRGVVCDQEGRPLAGARVQERYGIDLRRWRDGTGRDLRLFPADVRVTDENGEFVLERPRPFQPAELLIEADGRVPWAADLGSYMVEPRPIQATLLPGASRTGLVVDAEGRPAADVAVVLVGDGRRAHSTRTDAEGHFVLEPVAPGAAQLLLNPHLEAGLDARDLELQIPPGASAGSPIVLAAGRSVEGRARSSAGAPLAGWTVVARSAARHPRRTTRTDDSGHFAFGGLPEGSCQLSLYAPQSAESPSLVLEGVLIPSTGLELLADLDTSPRDSTDLDAAAPAPAPGRLVVEVPYDAFLARGIVNWALLGPGIELRDALACPTTPERPAQLIVDELPPGDYVLRLRGNRQIQLRTRIEPMQTQRLVAGELQCLPRKLIVSCAELWTRSQLALDVVDMQGELMHSTAHTPRYPSLGPRPFDQVALSLPPGPYTARVRADGLAALEVAFAVDLGTTAPALRLELE